MPNRILYILAAVTLVLFSCSKLPLGQGEISQLESNVPIEAAPAVQSGNDGWSTKALINSSTDLQALSISLFGFADTGTETYPVFENDILSYSQGVWGYGAVKYWIPGAYYTFGAFCPSVANANKSISNGEVSYNSGTLTISNYVTGRTDSFDARSEDLLYCFYERDNSTTNDYSAVPLQMQHLLSCLEFRIRNSANYDIVRIEEIYLANLEDIGTLHLDMQIGTISWDKSVSYGEPYFTREDRIGTNAVPFLNAGMQSGDSKPLFDCTYLTVLPQQVYGKDIYLVFTAYRSEADTEGTKYNINLGTIGTPVQWESGKKYRYTFSINSKDITFQVSEIPWKEDNITL